MELSDSHVAELTQLFRKFDRDSCDEVMAKDVVLVLAELGLHLNVTQVKKATHEMDPEITGSVDLLDFLGWCRRQARSGMAIPYLTSVKVTREVPTFSLRNKSADLVFWNRYSLQRKALSCWRQRVQTAVTFGLKQEVERLRKDNVKTENPTSMKYRKRITDLETELQNAKDAQAKLEAQCAELRTAMNSKNDTKNSSIAAALKEVDEKTARIKELVKEADEYDKKVQKAWEFRKRKDSHRSIMVAWRLIAQRDASQRKLEPLNQDATAMRSHIAKMMDIIRENESSSTRFERGVDVIFTLYSRAKKSMCFYTWKCYWVGERIHHQVADLHLNRRHTKELGMGMTAFKLTRHFKALRQAKLRVKDHENDLKRKSADADVARERLADEFEERALKQLEWTRRISLQAKLFRKWLSQVHARQATAVDLERASVRICAARQSKGWRAFLEERHRGQKRKMAMTLVNDSWRRALRSSRDLAFRSWRLQSQRSTVMRASLDRMQSRLETVRVSNGLNCWRVYILGMRYRKERRLSHRHRARIEDISRSASDVKWNVAEAFVRKKSEYSLKQTVAFWRFRTVMKRFKKKEQLLDEKTTMVYGRIKRDHLEDEDLGIKFMKARAFQWWSRACVRRCYKKHRHDLKNVRANDFIQHFAKLNTIRAFKNWASLCQSLNKNKVKLQVARTFWERKIESALARSFHTWKGVSRGNVFGKRYNDLAMVLALRHVKEKINSQIQVAFKTWHFFAALHLKKKRKERDYRRKARVQAIKKWRDAVRRGQALAGLAVLANERLGIRRGLQRWITFVCLADLGRRACTVIEGRTSRELARTYTLWSRFVHRKLAQQNLMKRAVFHATQNARKKYLARWGKRTFVARTRRALEADAQHHLAMRMASLVEAVFLHWKTALLRKQQRRLERLEQQYRDGDLISFRVALAHDPKVDRNFVTRWNHMRKELLQRMGNRMSIFSGNMDGLLHLNSVWDLVVRCVEHEQKLNDPDSGSKFLEVVQDVCDDLCSQHSIEDITAMHIQWKNRSHDLAEVAKEGANNKLRLKQSHEHLVSMFRGGQVMEKLSSYFNYWASWYQYRNAQALHFNVIRQRSDDFRKREIFSEWRLISKVRCALKSYKARVLSRSSKISRYQSLGMQVIFDRWKALVQIRRMQATRIIHSVARKNNWKQYHYFCQWKMAIIVAHSRRQAKPASVDPRTEQVEEDENDELLLRLATMARWCFEEWKDVVCERNRRVAVGRRTETRIGKDRIARAFRLWAVIAASSSRRRLEKARDEFLDGVQERLHESFAISEKRESDLRNVIEVLVEAMETESIRRTTGDVERALLRWRLHYYLRRYGSTKERFAREHQEYIVKSGALHLWKRVSCSQRRHRAIVSKMCLRMCYRSVSSAFGSWEATVVKERRQRAILYKCLEKTMQRNVQLSFIQWRRARETSLLHASRDVIAQADAIAKKKEALEAIAREEEERMKLAEEERVRLIEDQLLRAEQERRADEEKERARLEEKAKAAQEAEGKKQAASKKYSVKPIRKLRNLDTMDYDDDEDSRKPFVFKDVEGLTEAERIRLALQYARETAERTAPYSEVSEIAQRATGHTNIADDSVTMTERFLAKKKQENEASSSSVAEGNDVKKRPLSMAAISRGLGSAFSFKKT